MNAEPAWLTEARKDIGLKEIPGAQTEPRIQKWLVELNAWWRDDETPWCGTACAAWMSRAGIEDLPKHWYRAKGWLEWGTELGGPAVGAVVVFERDGGGHVGIVVGLDDSGHLLVLGGNQGNMVKVAPFDHARVVGYRWPLWRPDMDFIPAYKAATTLPIYASSGRLSRNEA